MKNLTKYIFSIIFWFVLSFGMSAQTRLHTYGAIHLINKNNSNFVTSVIDSSFYKMPVEAFFDYGHSDGFYLDCTDTSIVYRHLYENQDTVKIFPVTDSYSYKEVIRYYPTRIHLNATVFHALEDLIQLVVMTSSPQAESEVIDGSIGYFISSSEVAECVVDSKIHGRLYSLMREVCAECKEKRMPVASYLLPQILELKKEYKELINKDYWRSEASKYLELRFGINNNTVDYYIVVEVAKGLDFGNDDETNKKVLFQLMDYLIAYSDGNVGCQIYVTDDLKKRNRQNNDLCDIVIFPEEFQADKLIEICGKILFE